MRSEGLSSIFAVTFLYSTLPLLSIGPRSIAGTMGKPSVCRKLPSTAADTLFHWSLPKKSNLGLL